MKRLKDQYMVHCKRTTQIGCEKAMQPTPPKGSGWRLVSNTAEQNLFIQTWHRRSRQPLPTNDYPYS